MTMTIHRITKYQINMDLQHKTTIAYRNISYNIYIHDTSKVKVTIQKRLNDLNPQNLTFNNLTACSKKYK